MAKGERAFWSSLPGVLTGLAGTLTAGVALLGLALSQGWIGDGGSGTADDSDAGAGVVRISVDPDPLELTELPSQEAMETVTVTNDGTEPVTVTTEITGNDEASFEADDGDCTRSAIPPGGRCDVDVTLEAGPGTYQATLVVSVNDDEQVQKVELRGRSGNILGR
jgi:hypothetical protein